MKYKGKKLAGRNTDIIVFQKGTDVVAIKAEAIQNFKEFDSLVQEPEPPNIYRPGGVKEKDLKNPEYLKSVDDYAEKRTAYIILKSLECNEDIEWEYVKIDNPDTYKHWRKEFEDSGFTEIETGKIMQLCFRVNSLDNTLMDQAKEAFLAEAQVGEK